MNNDDDGILNGDRFEFESNLMNAFQKFVFNYSVLCCCRCLSMTFKQCSESTYFNRFESESD